MMTNNATITKEETDVDTTVDSDETTDSKDKHQVVLENNDYNSFEFIIEILCAYVPKMTPEKAENHAWEIHTNGKSVIYRGDFEECSDIAIDIGRAKEKRLGQVLPPPTVYVE